MSDSNGPFMAAASLFDEVARLRALLETANIYGAGENAARLAAEEDRDRLRAVSDVLFDARIPLVEEVDRLRAEVASLKADAMRYRWLRDEGDRTWSPMKNLFPEGAKGVDAAIDFALKDGMVG